MIGASDNKQYESPLHAELGMPLESPEKPTGASKSSEGTQTAQFKGNQDWEQGKWGETWEDLETYSDEADRQKKILSVPPDREFFDMPHSDDSIAKEKYPSGGMLWYRTKKGDPVVGQNIDREHHVPLVASALTDDEGNMHGMAIDHRIPPRPEYEKHLWNHEAYENSYMNNLLKNGFTSSEAYAKAHDWSTAFESAAVEAEFGKEGLEDYKQHWRDAAAIAREPTDRDRHPDAHTTRHGLDESELGMRFAQNMPKDIASDASFRAKEETEPPEMKATEHKPFHALNPAGPPPFMRPGTGSEHERKMSEWAAKNNIELKPEDYIQGLKSRIGQMQRDARISGEDPPNEIQRLRVRLRQLESGNFEKVAPKSVMAKQQQMGDNQGSSSGQMESTFAGPKSKGFQEGVEAGKEQSFLGADLKPRLEIPDENMKLKTENFEHNGEGKYAVGFFKDLKLKDIIDHPELFKAYPELKDIKIKSYHGLEGDRTTGSFNTKTNELSIADWQSPDEIKDTLVHEIQHWIQKKEGFTSGASLELIKPYVDRAIENKGILPEHLGLKTPEEQKAVLQKAYFDAYEKVGGEVESRNVTFRRDFSALKRRLYSPKSTEDVPRHLQLNSPVGREGPQKSYPRSEVDLDKVRELINQGKSQRQIADELNIGRKVLRRRLNEMDARTRREFGQGHQGDKPKKGKTFWSEDMTKQLLQKLDENKNTHQISKEMNIHHSTIKKQIDKIDEDRLFKSK